MKGKFSPLRMFAVLFAGSLFIPAALAAGALWRYQSVPWRLVALGALLNFVVAIPTGVFAGIPQTSGIPFRAAALTGIVFALAGGWAINPRGDTVAAVWVAFTAGIAGFTSLLAGVLGSIATIARAKR